ncbi:MAG: serine/threonine-protein kinase [Acidobacteriota bacterium]
METLLKQGQMVVARNMQSACIVRGVLGEGAQAEVYRATIGDHEFALKWYRPEYVQVDPRLWDRLKEAINIGSPSEQFLWPFDLASLPGSTGYSGYLMPIKPPTFISLIELMRGKSDPAFRSLATVGFLLADSFFKLHSNGLCYRDINFGNFFFEPNTGDIRIGDTDNVDITGRPGSIKGTPGFMAPEVGRNEAHPSTTTDRFSLATLLFNIFMIGHPLKGKREMELKYDATDPDGSRRLCADDPIFVFDPLNERNRPLPGIHDAMLSFWPIYPQSLRDLFLRSFTVGLWDPDARVMENEWRKETCRLRDSIFLCPGCKAENFMDLDRIRRKVGMEPCWSCKRALEVPARMRVGVPNDACVVVLNPGIQLFAHHLNGARYSFGQPLAEVVLINPSGEGLALKNLSAATWSYQAEGGANYAVAPGGFAQLTNNSKLRFGATDGDVRL